MDNFSIFLSILPSKGNHSEYTHTHTQFDIFYAHAHTYLFFQYEMSILICNFFHLMYYLYLSLLLNMFHNIILKVAYYHVVVALSHYRSNAGVNILVHVSLCTHLLFREIPRCGNSGSKQMI